MDISNELLVIAMTTVLIISALWLGYDWGFKGGRNFAKSQYEHEIELLQDMVVELEKRLSIDRTQPNSLGHSFYKSYENLQEMFNRISSAYKKQFDKIEKLKDELLNVKVENKRLKKELIGEKEGLEAQALKEEPKFEGANKEKIESLRKIIEPIEQWINENACPHDKLIITQGNVEFTSGEFGIPLDIKD